MIITKKINYKEPQGKLLRIKVTFDSGKNRLKSVIITGDFFIYPEEKLIDIEKALINISIERQKIINVIETFMDTEDVQLFGITPEGISDAIVLSVKT
ncbi:MAG: hypothetical protein JW855_04100 [Gammaproteobacteria bacterium]|nr:hypothetical protein [Gammaproteobacteria bacterium]